MSKYNKEWLEVTRLVYGYLIKEEADTDMLLEGITANDGGCPCVPKYAQSAKTLCPCQVMRTKGKCHCGLFQNMC